jgi:hypothetical protein
MIEEFVDDDAGYLAWLARHADGFVVNCDVVPRAEYVVLHRASCGTISGAPARGASWTVAYKKVCSVDSSEVVEWVRGAIGSSPAHCHLCTP